MLPAPQTPAAPAVTKQQEQSSTAAAARAGATASANATQTAPAADKDGISKVTMIIIAVAGTCCCCKVMIALCATYMKPKYAPASKLMRSEVSEGGAKQANAPNVPLKASYRRSVLEHKMTDGSDSSVSSSKEKKIEEKKIDPSSTGGSLSVRVDSAEWPLEKETTNKDEASGSESSKNEASAHPSYKDR